MDQFKDLILFQEKLDSAILFSQTKLLHSSGFHFIPDFPSSNLQNCLQVLVSTNNFASCHSEKWNSNPRIFTCSHIANTCLMASVSKFCTLYSSQGFRDTFMLPGKTHPNPVMRFHLFVPPSRSSLEQFSLLLRVIISSLILDQSF